jgi:hypothetical protein
VKSQFERGELVRLSGTGNEIHIVLGRSAANSHYWQVCSLASGKRYVAPFYWIRELKRGIGNGVLYSS